jgi:hypothetical protein
VNRRILAFLLLLACACSRLPEGQQRELIDHWPAKSGREPVVRVRGQEVVSDGEWVKDGEFVFYDERGREQARGAYRLGREHGPWTQIEPDGDVGRGEFREGRRMGKWTYSYPGGQPQEEGGYVRGTRQGFWTRWHENGQVRAEVMYKDGELHGTCNYWFADGREDVKHSGRYERGEKVE